jgi:hypothetical protein
MLGSPGVRRTRSGTAPEKGGIMKYHKNGALIPLTSLLFLILMPLASANKVAPQSSEPYYLYKATFVRGAPGKLLDLIDLYKNQMNVYDTAGDERPFWWRHTQGDQWDLMLLFPMESFTEYYSPDRVKKRRQAANNSGLSAKAFDRKFKACSSWHEDIFVFGPPLEKVKTEFKDSAYYHIEIFIALAGKHEELYKERQMENAYQMALGRPWNMIFVRDQGASWDIFTLGCYRSLKHWAESEGIPQEKREAAARAAGFESPAAIGPYMRTLILMHRDTMGVAIK